MKNPISRILLPLTLITVDCFFGVAPLQAQTFGQVDGSTYASLNAAVTAIGGAQKTLVVWTALPVTANVTVPTTLTLKFISPGQLTINGSAQVTINGPLQAPLIQIFGFNTTNSNPVVFGKNSVPGVYPQWWGAVGNGSNTGTIPSTNTKAILMATAAMSRVFFPGGIYYVNSLSIAASNISWEGHSGTSSDADVKSASILRSSGGQTNVLQLSGSDCTFEFMTFDGAFDAALQEVVYLRPPSGGAKGNVFRRCTVEHAPTAGALVYLDGGASNYPNVFNHFIECEIEQDHGGTTYCGMCVYLAGTATSNNTFEKCRIVYGGELVKFNKGGGSFLNCLTAFWNTTSGHNFYVYSFQNPIEVAGCYTEGTTFSTATDMPLNPNHAWWFLMENPNAWSNSTITLRNNILNDPNENMQLYPTCPIQLFNNTFSGFVNIDDPGGTTHVAPVLCMGNSFNYNNPANPDTAAVDFGPVGGKQANNRNEISTSLNPAGTQSAQMRTQLTQLAIGGQPPLTLHLSTTAALNFIAPGGVPGTSLATLSLPGAKLGDQVTVSASIPTPANFILTGYVSAANMITVCWTQIAGTMQVDPDGAGGATYRASIWHH